MRMHDITKDVRDLYCGPGAICSITNWPASTVLNAFRKIRTMRWMHGHPRVIHTAHGTYSGAAMARPDAIKGACPQEIQEVLSAFGYKMRGAVDDSARNVFRRLNAAGRIAPGVRRPTFGAWVSERMHPDRMYLVIVSNHYVLVHGDEWIDNMSLRPRLMNQLRFKRGRVRAVYRITAPEGWSRPQYAGDASLPEHTESVLQSIPCT